MNYVVIGRRSKVQMIEAESVEDAARTYFMCEDAVSNRVSSCQVADTEKGELREFEIKPPPRPSREEWIVKEYVEADDDDDLDDDDDDF